VTTALTSSDDGGDKSVHKLIAIASASAASLAMALAAVATGASPASASPAGAAQAGASPTSNKPASTKPAKTKPASSDFSLGFYNTATSHFHWYSPKQWKASPQDVITYLAWGEGFPTQFAELAHKHGAEVFAELAPWQCSCGTVTLKDVAKGKEDGYLKSFAAAVHKFGHPVQVTFAHEMNGNWYPWGYQADTPAEWIAAWDHVYDVIHPIASNIEWIWAPNTQYGARPVTPYWPGAKTVDAVGLDCYISEPGMTYASQCASTVTAIRKLTSKPIFIGETGAAPDANRPQRLTSFIDAVRAAGLTGLYYFDRNQFQLSSAGQSAVRKAIGR
jgi:mannan endo-1,4-beta-mannosidase